MSREGVISTAENPGVRMKGGRMVYQSFAGPCKMAETSPEKI
jgi:hypothetical protein